MIGQEVVMRVMICGLNRFWYWQKSSINAGISDRSILQLQDVLNWRQFQRKQHSQTKDETSRFGEFTVGLMQSSLAELWELFDSS